MSKVNLVFPKDGEPGKKYWLVCKSDDLVDQPSIVVCEESLSMHKIKFTKREGAMSMIYSPDKMQDKMLIEIVVPDRQSVIKELQKRRIIKKPKKEIPKSGLNFD